MVPIGYVAQCLSGMIAQGIAAGPLHLQALSLHNRVFLRKKIKALIIKPLQQTACQLSSMQS